MAPAHESETIVFNFRKLLSTLPNYAELELILLFSVNWGKQVCVRLLHIQRSKNTLYCFAEITLYATFLITCIYKHIILRK